MHNLYPIFRCFYIDFHNVRYYNLNDKNLLKDMVIHMNILIFNENIHDKSERIKAVYPDGIHGALAGALAGTGDNITTVTLDDENCGITKEILNDTDVLIWWGHIAHHKVPDEIAEMVKDAVLKGMGFIALHSAHMSKPFKLLMGTSCTLKWREGSRERIWTISPGHPITKGIPEHFELPAEEMYGEFFDVPAPDETVLIGWFPSGEVFRSGITYRRGYGKVFYFQPGHEEYPVYFDENIVKILRNAVKWAASDIRIPEITCPNFQSLE